MSLLSDYLNARGVICVAITEEDYHGEHKAPSTDDAPLYDLSVVYPDDIYTGRGSDYAQEPSERYGLAEVLRCHNKPWARVQVFRAVPKDIKGAKINPGDWVTLSRQYAKEHGLRSLGGPGKYKILTLNAYARDLYTNGDSLAEWGYNPRPATAEEEAEVSSLREAKDLERIKRASTGEKIISINKYPEDHYYGKPDEFFADLLAQRQATASEEIPDTVEVDGKQRPTHNSKGRLIYPTVEGIINFWKWFGDSKVLDDAGNPLIIYHGTDANFDEFKPDFAGSRTNDESGYVEWSKIGPNLTSSPKYASEHAEGLGEGSVMPLYAKIDNPYEINEREWSDVLKEMENKNITANKFKNQLRNDGYDGIILYAKDTGIYSIHIIPFQSVQIKSATGNSGSFDVAKNEINAATNYQDDTEYAPDQAELTKLGLIFGQPQSKNDGIQVTYKGHTLEIRPDKKEIELSPAVPASRGRKYVPASVKDVPGFAVTGITPKGSVTNVLRAEDAEKWLRGLKAYWDRKQ